MRFISVRDLRGKSAEVWRDLVEEREMVVTSNGRPIAILAAVFVRRTRGRLRECAASSMDYWIRVGAVMGLLAIAIQELAEFSLQIPGNATLFVVMCALAVHSSDPPRAPAMVRVPRATTRRGPLRSYRLVFRETVVRFW